MAILVLSSAQGLGADTFTVGPLDSRGANLLVLGVAHYASGPTPTLTDSLGNSYTGLTDQVFGTTAYRLFYRTAPTVGAAHTFTLSGTGIFAVLGVLALSGAASAAPTVDRGAGVASDTTLAAGSLTPAVGDLLVSGLCSLGTAPSLGSGWTVRASDYTPGTNMGGALGWQLAATAAPVNPTWTWTGAAASAVAVEAGFAPAAGGAGPPSYLLIRAGTSTLPLRVG
jgi:hypothetical protein